MLILREDLLTQCLHLVNQRIISFIIWRRCNINYLCASGGSFVHSRNIGNNLLNSYDSSYRQKQPSRGVLKKRCFENMQQTYMRTPMPKCDFNKVAKQSNVIEIALRHGCSPVNVLHIFLTPFPKNTSGWFFLYRTRTSVYSLDNTVNFGDYTVDQEKSSTKLIHVCKKLPLALDCGQSKCS